MSHSLSVSLHLNNAWRNKKKKKKKKNGFRFSTVVCNCPRSIEVMYVEGYGSLEERWEGNVKENCSSPKNMAIKSRPSGV